MKKIVLSIFLAGVATASFAQKAEIREVEKQWKMYDAIGRNGAIDKRVQSLTGMMGNLDKAITHDDTKGQANVWSYRGLVSSNLAINDTSNVDFINQNIKIAKESLVKVKELDAKGTEGDRISEINNNIEVAVRNGGVIAYNKQNFQEAYNKFEELTVINPNDTAMYFNAGIVARELKNFDNATKMYKKVIELNHPQSESLYGEMINWTLASVKDTTAALVMVQDAVVKFPESVPLIQIETDIYLKRGEVKKSEEMLNRLATKEPNNSIYQALLGKIYLDQAIEVQEKMKDIDIKKKVEYDAAVKNRDELVNKSLPYFIKSVELDPKNVAALENLKLIYGFKNDTKNFEIIKKQLDAIPQG